MVIHGAALLAIVALIVPRRPGRLRIRHCRARLGRRLDRLGDVAEDAVAAGAVIRAVCRTCNLCAGP